MAFCILSRRNAVGEPPSACRSRSKRSMILSTAASLIAGIGALGSITWPARIAAARPKTTRSISELEPSRLAPCTEAQPASPTAIRPGDTRSGFVGGRVQHLAPIVRRDAAHIVVDRRQHRDRLAGHVDAGKNLRRFEMPGSRSCRTAGSRWSRCRKMWSLFLPTPRPSRISSVMQRETTSREARSLADGA